MPYVYSAQRECHRVCSVHRPPALSRRAIPVPLAAGISGPVAPSQIRCVVDDASAAYLFASGREGQLSELIHLVKHSPTGYNAGSSPSPSTRLLGIS